MSILAGDIKLLASQVMDDVPEGGGAPTSIVINDGVSNAVFPDINDIEWAGGGVRYRKLFAAVKTPNVETFMGANVIVAEPPKDPLVSVTIMSTRDVFDRRTDGVRKIENYLVAGPALAGYLLENHVAGQRIIQVLQRPGSALVPNGRTLILIINEGLPNEKFQKVRVIAVESETRTYTEIVGSTAVDFQAMVVRYELSDPLRSNFAGSPPTRLFAAAVGKTIIRDTTVADAGSYCGVAPLAVAATIGQKRLKAATVYSQLVPNARTESISVDIKPSATRQLVLATFPRAVSVGSAPHSRRIRVGQENRGYSWVQILKPFPASSSVSISYMALGEWYTMEDDGAGAFTGAGVGTVNYTNGSLAITLSALPDVGSSIITTWGEKSAFKNLSGLATFRAPEYGFQLEHKGVLPGTLEITWLSAGVLKTATDSGGQLTGHAAGEVNYATGDVFIRPSAMIDAGGEFNIDYDYRTTFTKTVAPSIDSGGFALIALDDVPAAGTVSLTWRTVRNVSNSSGATVSGQSAYKGPTYTTVEVMRPVADAPRPPVRMTRIPLSVKAGVSGEVTTVPEMYPGGTRLLSGETVFIAVYPSADEAGYFYNVPDATGVTWTEDEGEKSIGGFSYLRWGFHLRSQQLVSA